ncbi:MAG TPA: hypothetical protein VH594_22945 [Trebonia sp.]|jgi:hypothetical protein
MTSPEPEHLDGRHRDTLRRIFAHPTSHNVEWREVTSLLDAVGTVTVHGNRVTVQIGNERQSLERPSGKYPDRKDIDAQMIVDLRRILRNAGYEPS